MFTTFVDLEKTYDRVPRDLVYWSLRKRKVPEKLVHLVKATYKKATKGNNSGAQSSWQNRTV